MNMADKVNDNLDFVVLGKVRISDGKIGVRVIPLAKYTTPNVHNGSTFFSDTKGNGFLIGGIYRTPTHALDDEGKVVSLSVKNSTFVNRAEGDFTAAKLEEEELRSKDRHTKLEKRLKSEPVLTAEVEAIATMIRNLPRSQRYSAISVVSGVISERVFAI
jgi:hypothetical protein